MRNLYTLLTAIIITTSAFAQAPEIMSYQAVVRDAADNLVASSPVGMQISILQGSPSGTAAYVETHTPTSNQNGLVSIEIGNGTLVSGDFSTIDWANGPYFVKTETDPIGGTSYTITGTSQLLSVPYALFAKNSSAWQTIDDTTSTFNQVGIGSTSTYLGVELIVKDNVFASQLIESTGATTDAELWLKNPTGVWRIHGDQSDGNKFKLGLWTDYSEAGGSNILPNSMTVDTLGNVGIGTATPNSKLTINNGALTLGGLGSQSGIITMTNANDLKLYSGPPGNASSGIWFRSANIAGNVSGFTELMVIKSTGNVGIGTTSPARKLHVNDVMRLEPRSTAPTSPSKGDMYMDDITNKLMVYDGTNWQACW